MHLNAQDMYEKRRAIHRKMIVHPELKAAIEDQPEGWLVAGTDRRSHAPRAPSDPREP